MAYEIETRCHEMLGVSYCNSPREGRDVIRSLLRRPGDLRVRRDLIKVRRKQIKVQLKQLGALR